MKIKTPNKILLVIIKDMGDVILTTPMAEVLKYNYPNAQVDILVLNSLIDVVKHSPYIDNIITYDKKQSFKEILKIRSLKYDWVIDFLNNPRSAMICALSGAKLKAGLTTNIHKFYAYNFYLKRPEANTYSCDFKLEMLKQLGVKWKGEHAPLPVYKLSKEQEEKSLQIYKELNILPTEKVIGFYATTKVYSREWSIQNFQKTAELLHQKYNCQIMIICAPWEKDYALKIKQNTPWIHIASSTEKIEDIYPILKRLNLLISCCGGTKHLALSVAVPTITLHFITRVKDWTPVFNKKHIGIQAHTPCSPCRKDTCDKNYICKNAITPQEVFEAAQKILG
ncbi:MAG: glycosyltransferase family 9 protein [Elusimicrobiaceae bacterium]|nr:glycosyltransferase family 9 protein [Elusimicrobiaceae bacterium]